MSTPGIALVLLAFLILYECASRWVETARCAYCGVIAGHDEFCPYNGTGV